MQYGIRHAIITSHFGDCLLIQSEKRDESTLKKEFRLPRAVMLIALVLYLLAAWLIFSRNGFLPRSVSAPFSAERQKYSHVFNRTGYSYTSLRLHLNRETVEPGTIERLGFLDHNQLTGSCVYYSGDDHSYYVSTDDALISVDAESGKLRKLMPMAAQQKYFIKYDSLFLWANRSYFAAAPVYNWNKGEFLKTDVSRYTNYAVFDKNHQHIDDKFAYQQIAELLEKNETERISLTELGAVVNAAIDGYLDGWYPEDHTAVFSETADGPRYVYTYTIGDEEIKTYGPFERKSNERWYLIGEAEYLVWTQGEKTDSLSIWNYRTETMTKLTDAPMIDMLRYRVSESGQPFCVGTTVSVDGVNTLWWYRAETGESGTVTLGALYDLTYFSVGEDSVLLYSCSSGADGTSVIYTPQLSMSEGGEKR